MLLLLLFLLIRLSKLRVVFSLGRLTFLSLLAVLDAQLSDPSSNTSLARPFCEHNDESRQLHIQIVH